MNEGISRINMNLKFIFIFGILLTIDIVLSVLSDENSYECVKKRKSGWFIARSNIMCEWCE